MHLLTTGALALCALLFGSVTLSTQSAEKAPVAAAPAKPALNLNVATLDQLETLPGVGRRTAERILDTARRPVASRRSRS